MPSSGCTPAARRLHPNRRAGKSVFYALHGQLTVTVHAREGDLDLAAKLLPIVGHEAPANHAQLEGFFAQLGETLDDIDFHKGRAPEMVMSRLRRLYLRAGLDQREVKILRGILADAQRMARLAGGGGTGSLS